VIIFVLLPILLQNITVSRSSGQASLCLIPRSDNQGNAQTLREVSLLSTYAI